MRTIVDAFSQYERALIWARICAPLGVTQIVRLLAGA